MTDQTISVATSHSRFAQWLHELTSSQQKSYKTSVKEYKRKVKLIVKISQRMLKIDEAIRVFARSYILFEMMSAFIRNILQLLIIRYKKIDDQIKKQLHEKFQALKQSSFKNQIETWVTDWENLRNRILTFDIRNFFDFETMFVEKFLIADRKWISTRLAVEKRVPAATLGSGRVGWGKFSVEWGNLVQSTTRPYPILP
jgi:hypothetical protein